MGKEYDPEMPDGAEQCCSVRGERCVCVPYKDGFLITSQVLTIVSMFIAWIFWPVFLLNIVGTVLFQLLWCLRQSKATMYATAAVALVCAHAHIGVGIYVLTQWSKRKSCAPFIFITNLENTLEDICEENVWASIAIACGALWFVAGSYILHFVLSGKYSKREEYHVKSAENSNDDNDNNTGGPSMPKNCALPHGGVRPTAWNAWTTMSLNGTSRARHKKAPALYPGPVDMPQIRH